MFHRGLAVEWPAGFQFVTGEVLDRDCDRQGGLHSEPEPVNTRSAAFIGFLPGVDVQFTTEFTARESGFPGRIERYLTRRILNRIYEKELALISAYAKEIGVAGRPA